MDPLSLYLHVPFCTVKCSYCAFNIYTHLEHLIDPYVEALCREVEQVGGTNPGHRLHTVYFGGGTPTLLTANQYERVLQTIYDCFDVEPDVEISTEANPDDLARPGYLEALRSLGIERLSIGVQSTHQSQLQMFGRLHNAETVAEAVGLARAAGFDDLNLDLIYGIPAQTLPMWKETLSETIRLHPEHISLYALGVEPKTAMAYWIENGKLDAPDDDLAADMYELASEWLAAAGYRQYEISNWAMPGRESRHNQQYWRNLPYLGLGPGAHGYAGGLRYVVERSPHRYIQAMQQTGKTRFPLTSAVAEQTAVSREDEISETIMMGLRLLEDGISLAAFESRFGIDLAAYRAEEIQRYTALGMLEQVQGRLRLTAQGRFVSNHILRDLV